MRLLIFVAIIYMIFIGINTIRRKIEKYKIEQLKKEIRKVDEYINSLFDS